MHGKDKSRRGIYLVSNETCERIKIAIISRIIIYNEILVSSLLTNISYKEKKKKKKQNHHCK